MLKPKELRDWGEDVSAQRRDAWETLLLELDARISLTQTQYEGLNARYETVGGLLEDPVDPALGEIIVIPQGSFATRTVTKPPDREDVDVDAIAYLKGGASLSPLALHQHLFDELDARARTGGEVRPYNRCVRIQYSDVSLPCHLDVTPAERRPGNTNDDGSGLLQVPDRKLADWSPSNPVDFAAWFNGIAEAELTLRLTENYRNWVIAKRGETQPLPSHEEITAPNGLRVAVRLMKRHRDVYAERTGRQKSKPISVILTTLAAKAYAKVAANYAGRALGSLDLIEAVVREMPNGFDTPTATGRYQLLNPRDAGENFAEKWNDDPARPATFYAWHEALQQSLRYGYLNFPSKERFRRELAESFGTSAGRACDDYMASIGVGTYPGLSPAAANAVRVAGKSAALIGLGRQEPTRAAEPEPLDRLG